MISASAAAPARQAGVRAHNLALLLGAVDAASASADGVPPSRAALAAATGLTRATVSALVDDLVAGGLLTETEPAPRAGAGRPAAGLTVSPSGPAGVGCEVNVDFLAVCVVDPTGVVRHRQVIHTDQREETAAYSLGRLGEMVVAARAAAEAEGLVAAGVALAVPGLVSGGVVRVAPNLGWPDVDAIGLLRAIPGISDLSVTVDNEANLAALGELRAAGRGAQAAASEDGGLALGGRAHGPNGAEPNETEPGPGGPGAGRPSRYRPGVGEPAVAEPPAGGPSVSGPSVAGPGLGEPRGDEAHAAGPGLRPRRPGPGGLGLGGRPSFVYVSGEVGIGAGLVLDGELHRGGRGWSGEIGHLTIYPDGSLCRCGAQGCLEVYAGIDAIRSAADFTGEDGAMETAGRALGIALSAVVNLLDVDTVVLGGAYAPMLPLLRAPIEAELRRRVLTALLAPVTLRAAAGGADATMRGAAESVLRGVRENPAAWLARASR